MSTNLDQLSITIFLQDIMHFDVMVTIICIPKLVKLKNEAAIYWPISKEFRQAISELSRELSTNEISLFSIVLSARVG